MAQFCTKCGAVLNEGMKFCPACGASSVAPAAPSAQAPAAQIPVAPPVVSRPAVASARPAPVASAAAPAKSGSPILKIVLGILLVMFLLAVLSIGAGVYFYYYHVKPKVAQIENTVRTFPIPSGGPQTPAGSGGPGAAPNSPSNNPGANPADLGKVLGQFGIKVPGMGAAAPDNRPDPHFPALMPGDPSVYSGQQLVFQPGMTTAVSMSTPVWGDYDVLTSITAVSEKGVTSNISAQSPANKQATSPSQASVNKAHETHTDTQQDLLHATNLMPLFSSMFPEVIPGTTSSLISQDAFRAIKSGSGIDLTTAKNITFVTLGAVPDNLWSTLDKYTCHATRAEAADAAFPVLLNGKSVTLPAVHYTCPHPEGPGATYILDDDKMPLFLATRDGQVTQINYPQTAAKGGQSIEQALKKEGRVDVYGIYFDFSSDQLRPESTPVLEEIASALKDNSTWKLHVNGHTDNVGGDAYNLDLSNRRADAVKRALVTQYHIEPARLDPNGFGATQPKEPNDTPQGRARNRRVELVRE